MIISIFFQIPFYAFFDTGFRFWATYHQILWSVWTFQKIAFDLIVFRSYNRFCVFHCAHCKHYPFLGADLFHQATSLIPLLQVPLLLWTYQTTFFPILPPYFYNDFYAIFIALLKPLIYRLIELQIYLWI